MAHRRFVSPPGTGHSITGTTGCPRVADLIQYALGLAGLAERQRVDEHLKRGGCDSCRRWLDNAARHRSRLPADASPQSSFLLDRPRGLPPAPPPTDDPTPLPESAKWQRSAFAELESRLRELEQFQERPA
ncbi:MAG TPA: hypothetical protein VFA18_04940 [Gemmataceae bacterium]|nr:hypothetical protein [Gemmataceae bacterium]